MKSATTEERKLESETIKRTAETTLKPIAEMRVTRRRGNGCQFCGKRGHHVRYCYRRRQQYERAWRMNVCFVEPSAYGHVWIAKRDLYPNYKEASQTVLRSENAVLHTKSEQEIVCNLTVMHSITNMTSNVAFTSTEDNSQEITPWYFDSGCSKHMTGRQDYIEKLECIKGGKVTFGDGAQGKI